MSAETKWQVEARLIFERADVDGDGGIDFEEFVHAAQGMPVLALGLALFRQVHGAAQQAGAAREARAASLDVQGLTAAIERAVVISSRVVFRVSGNHRTQESQNMGGSLANLGNLLHRSRTEYEIEVPTMRFRLFGKE